MKNPLRPKYIPLLALGGGAIGFALQLWLLSSGIDKKGLILTGHPASILLFLLTGAVILGLFLCALPATGKKPYRSLFPTSRAAALGYWVAAAGVACKAYAFLFRSSDTVTFLCGILAAGAVISLIIVGFCRLKGIRPNPLLHSVVAAYLMLHLVCQYRDWSAEPQIQSYFFSMMASVFLMLGCYYLAVLDADKTNMQQCIFFSYGALFFCFLSLSSDAWLFYGAMAIWIALSGCQLHTFEWEYEMELPDNVQLCLEMLNDAGFDAYVVGGCVRDSLLGLTPDDYDICTEASPRQVAKIFSGYQQVHSGEKHGTVGVIMDRQVYEITTFRTEGGYSDSRHPDWVEFVDDLQADLARRDFTVNAIAYSPITGYIDPFGGEDDLNSGILRTVGNAEERFTEDPLRILRGVRFAARFSLTPHPPTEQAMCRLAHTMDRLARERVFAELSKLILNVSPEDLIRYAPVICQAIPELAPAIGFDQHSPHHEYDVYTHIAHVVATVEPKLPLRLAALLHDIGKPATYTTDENGRGHFYGHAAKSAKLADDILLQLRAPTALRQEVVFLIEQHMLLLEPEKKSLRRWISKFGADRLKALVQLQKADFCGKGIGEQSDYFAQVDALIHEIIAENACLQLRDLAVNGDDLMAMGFAPGPKIGQVLNDLLDGVLDERFPNEKAALLSAAKSMIK